METKSPGQQKSLERRERKKMARFRDEAISRPIQNNLPRLIRPTNGTKKRSSSLAGGSSAAVVEQFHRLSLNLEGSASPASSEHPCGRRSEDEQSVQTCEVSFYSDPLAYQPARTSKRVHNVYNLLPVPIESSECCLWLAWKFPGSTENFLGDRSLRVIG